MFKKYSNTPPLQQPIMYLKCYNVQLIQHILGNETDLTHSAISTWMQAKL